MADEIDQAFPEGPAQAISKGKRHLVVRDYFNAVTVLAQGCGMLAEQHGDTSDELAEPYLLYGRALLGLAREEQAVLGTGVPGQDGEEDEEAEEAGENEPEEAADVPAEEDKPKEEATKEDKAEEKSEESKDEKVEDKEKPEDDKEKSEEKVEEKAAEDNKDKGKAKLSNGDATPSTSAQNGEPHENGVAPEEEEGEDLEDEDDDPNSNLQLAWEVLELAKLILAKRGEAGHKLLAEAHRLLGEVAMESGNQTSALTDLNACLDLLRNIDPADARSMAETHYQLGLAYALGNEFDSSVEQFQEATSLLETRIKELESQTEPVKPEDDPFYTVEGEIKELKELLPEIQEKIADMRDFKAQACKQLLENIKSHVSGGSCSNGAGPSGAGSSSSSSAGASTSSAAASDISHLVRKKRKTDEETDADGLGSPCKKPNTVSPGKSA